jgi:uncharacterized DUF497 family protein
MLEWDEEKRLLTLEKRGLNFADAAFIFAGETYNFPDCRKDYGEQRIITIGFLLNRMVVLVWTPRSNNRRIISMRKANEREYEEYIVKFSRER